MINNGVEINFLSSDFSPLMCSMGNIEIMNLLISKGADINLRNKMNMTALTIAVMSNETDAVKLLLENKAEINIPSTINGKTPMIFAKENRNIEIIKLLELYSKEK
ncbi:MAG: ankyrin repeat domain-containing protein [Candidatus Delongbacteria bacterium]|nr:ankyrin repeat domain-containing protein [Candidatus Delongbacteria bacterium]